MSARDDSSRERSLEAATAFEWDALAQYKADKRSLDHYPDDFRTFWAPRVAMVDAGMRNLLQLVAAHDCHNQ